MVATTLVPDQHPFTAAARRAPRKTDICSPSGSSAMSVVNGDNAWLVVEPTPLKNMTSSMGRMTSHI